MDNTAYNITKAIGYTENGGKPDIKSPSAGKTGEMASIFQYEPETFKGYAKQVTGNSDTPLTPDNEVKITQAKVQQWLNQGMTPQQIFSSWNAGPGEPNAYTGKFSDGQSSVGVNSKYGVKYDVPRYVDKAMSYFNEFNGSGQPTPQSNQTPANPQSQPGLLTSNTQSQQNNPQSSNSALTEFLQKMIPPA